MDQRHGNRGSPEYDGAVLMIAPNAADDKLQQEDGHPDGRQDKMHCQRAGGLARRNVDAGCADREGQVNLPDPPERGKAAGVPVQLREPERRHRL